MSLTRLGHARAAAAGRAPQRRRVQRRGDGAALIHEGRCRAAKLLHMLQTWRMIAGAATADENVGAPSEGSGARQAALGRAWTISNSSGGAQLCSTCRGS